MVKAAYYQRTPRPSEPKCTRLTTPIKIGSVSFGGNYDAGRQ
jgi:hypothetical protein